jgi:primary-amine oxidase
MDMETKTVVRLIDLRPAVQMMALSPRKGTTSQETFSNTAMRQGMSITTGQIPPRGSEVSRERILRASFTISKDGLLECQKWRFRLAFNPFHEKRLFFKMSAMRTDPFCIASAIASSHTPMMIPSPLSTASMPLSLGMGFFLGRAVNNLELGCDCLWAIHHVDSYLSGSDDLPTPAQVVVCLHEEDNGILWKHTNFRTNRSVVARMRELVVQFIVTLAN